jgi:hypothetical protein
MGNRVGVKVSVIILLLAVTVAASFLMASIQSVELGDAHQTAGWGPTPFMDHNGNVYVILRTE